MNPWKLASACLALVCGYLWFARGGFSNRDAATQQLTFSPITNDAGLTAFPAISPDGSLAVYASDREGGNLDLYLQQLPGGAPVRLTATDTDESEPAISPNGAAIAFRSEQDGGGIRAMPASGGASRMLAPGGHDPRYSPDGKWIVYWSDAAASVIPADGGTPRAIFPDMPGVRNPVWSPDGSVILACTAEDYVVGPVGGKAAPTGILPRLAQVKGAAREPNGVNWTSDGLTFVVRTGWVRNVWRMPLNGSGKPSGDPVRVTRGLEQTGELAVSRDGRILITSGSERFNVWGLPLDANAGRVAGEPYRITDGPPTTENPALSADGRRLLYDAQRFGVQELFLRDLDSGQERKIATGPLGVSWGQFLGSQQIGYRVRTQTGSEAWMIDVAGGEPHKVADRARWWGSNGDAALLESAAGVEAVNLRSGDRSVILRGPTSSQAWFSPDSRWVVFRAGPRICAARVNGSHEIPASEWATVAQGTVDKPRFSPNGRLIYFTRDTGRVRGIFAVSFDPQTGHAGVPFPVWQPHDVRLSLAAVNPAALELGIARDKLVVLLAERSFRLWMADRQ